MKITNEMNRQVDIEKSWFELLKDEFNQEYFISLKEFIRLEYKTKRTQLNSF